MASLTEQLNGLVAAYVGVKDSMDKDAIDEAARRIADLCQTVFTHRFVVGTDDGKHMARLPHKSSQDAYRETWRKQGHNVTTHTLELIVSHSGSAWYRGEGRNDRP